MEQGKERGFALGGEGGFLGAAPADASAAARRVHEPLREAGGVPAVHDAERAGEVRRYTTSGLRYRDGRLTLAKMSEPLDIRWSLATGETRFARQVRRGSASRVTSPRSSSPESHRSTSSTAYWPSRRPGGERDQGKGGGDDGPRVGVRRRRHDDAAFPHRVAHQRLDAAGRVHDGTQPGCQRQDVRREPRAAPAADQDVRVGEHSRERARPSGAAGFEVSRTEADSRARSSCGSTRSATSGLITHTALGRSGRSPRTVMGRILFHYEPGGVCGGRAAAARGQTRGSRNVTIWNDRRSSTTPPSARTGRSTSASGRSSRSVRTARPASVPSTRTVARARPPCAS